MPRKADSAAALARSICQRATVIGLRDACEELGQLVRSPGRRVIPPGPAGRRMLLRMLVAERRRSKRLLALLAQ